MFEQLVKRLRYGRSVPPHFFTAPAPARPIVLIQSDDWGRVGIPSREVVDEIRNAGFRFGESPWDFYGLESPEDVAALMAGLLKFHDRDGTPACMTANFVMGNADLRAMAANDWRAFCWKSIGDGFPDPWDVDLISSYRRAIESRAFYPALHGYTHFNVSELMAALVDPGDLGRRARALATKDVPYARSLTPEFNFALARGGVAGDLFLDKAKQSAWIKAGVEAFEKVFGFRPVSMCPPGYRANQDTRTLLADAGLKAIQNGQFDVPHESGGLLELGRNVYFEPCLAEGDEVGRALSQANDSISAGLPVIICTHSINYVSRFLGRAEHGRAELERLLSGLCQAHPNLRFASDGSFVSAWHQADSDWFRAPTEKEKNERIRQSVVRTLHHQAMEATQENLRASGGALPALQAEVGDASDGHTTVSWLGGQTFYVVLGAIFALIIGFPMQIYVARVLGAEGLGIVGLVEGAVATFSTFLAFGIAPTVVRFIPFYIEKNKYGSVRALIFGGGLLLLVVGLASYVVWLSSIEWLVDWWPSLADKFALIILMGILIPVGLLTFFVQQTLRGFHDVRYMIVGTSVIQILAKAVLTLALLGWGLGIIGYGLAIVLSTGCALAWMGWGVYRRLQSLPALWDSEDRHQWYRYATISYLSGVVSGAPAYLDRFLIGYFFDARAIGIFLIARRLQQLPGMFNQMLLVASAPMFARAYGRDDAEERQRIYTLMTDWTMRASLPLFVFLTIFAGPILRIFGADFADGGTEVLLVLVLGQFTNLISGPVGNVAIMNGLESKVLRLDTIVTVLSLGLMVILIPGLGALGAAAGSAISWLALSVMLIGLIRRDLHMHWWDTRFKSWFLPTATALIVSLAIRSFGFDEGVVKLTIDVIVLHAVFVVACLIQGLHQDDKELLRYFWRTYLRGRFGRAAGWLVG